MALESVEELIRGMAFCFCFSGIKSVRYPESRTSGEQANESQAGGALGQMGELPRRVRL